METNQPQHFLSILRLTPAHQDFGTWTQAQHDIVAAHFAYLQVAERTGKLLLAGRTDEAADSTFGIAVFVANSPAEAEAWAQADPSVVHKLMTVEVRPFRLALMGNSPDKNP